jgi:hypothetical protein
VNFIVILKPLCVDRRRERRASAVDEGFVSGVNRDREKRSDGNEGYFGEDASWIHWKSPMCFMFRTPFVYRRDVSVFSQAFVRVLPKDRRAAFRPHGISRLCGKSQHSGAPCGQMSRSLLRKGQTGDQIP